MLSKNIRIVSTILEEKIPNYKFDKFESFFLSIGCNRKTFYIGSRYEEKTLFRHCKNDQYYYDILDKNKTYQLESSSTYERDIKNVCYNVESIDELVKKYKKEERY